MPAQSKQQQKFMGIVRAIQKGDQPASKFSKDAQDAADDMKKKDVEDFASTKHKGLPKKVEQALREKIRTMVEDYVESCGYVVSAKDPNYKLKSPGGTGEEDKELKENAGVPNKMRAGFKKLKNKEGLSQEERNELYKAYKGIVELLTYGNFYDNKKPNKRRKELSELTFDINYALVGSKRLGSYQGRFEAIFKKFLNMINTQIKREEKGLKTDYRKAMRASKLDDVKNIFKNMTKYARTQKGIEKGTNEGFGSDEFLTKTEKKKFEKERLENAEVLGYTLTGKKDIKEAITGSARKNLLKIGKEIKNNLFRINPGLKKVKDNRLLIRGLANTFMFMRYTPDNANYQNYKKYFPKNFKSSSVQKLANILQNEPETVRKTFFKQVVKENESKKESVFAVRQDKIKNGERFPKEPNFDYDPEKGKSRIRKVNEASAVIDTETITQKVVKFTGVKANSSTHKHLKHITKKVGANLKKVHGGYIVSADNDMKKLSAVIDYVKKKMKKSKVNEGKGVDKIMKMADDYSYGKIAGKTVDVMTAKLFQAVYKKASQKARDRVDKMNEKQLYIFMMNLWKKFGKQLTLSS